MTSSLISTLGDELGPHLCLIPFATLLENIAGIYVPLMAGRTIVVDSPQNFGLLSNNQFDTARFCQVVATHGIASVILFPQILQELIHDGDMQQLRSLTFAAVGGGKVSADLLRGAAAKGLPIYEGYGLSECASVVALNTAEANKLGSVGKPLPHVQVRISDNGEVIVSGSTMLGYLHQAHKDVDIHTGDLGYFDEDGYLYIQGRIKNVLISSFGRNISPEWVESEYLLHSAIQQIAVLGDDMPHLVAVLYSDKGTTDLQISEAIKDTNMSLPDYARVQSWIRLEAPLSTENGLLTGNGKLAREQIKHHFQHYFARQEAS